MAPVLSTWPDICGPCPSSTPSVSSETVGCELLLVQTTEEYKLGGLSKPGFPLLLTADMKSCWEANEFLRFYLLRGNIESQRSWEPISRSLYDYFGFLEAHELEWNDVSRGENKNLLAAYRDYSFEVAHLARNTVRQRLTYVCEFYKYAARQGWIQKVPYSFEKRHVTGNGGFLAHVGGGGIDVEVRSVMPRKHADLAKYLTRDEAKALLRAANNLHHKTIVQTALLTGLRRAELASFPASYVFDPDRTGCRSRNVSVTLDPADGSGMRTKGSKRRVIWMSRQLMKTMHRYLIHHRGARSSLSQDEFPQLFLNQDGQPFADNGKGLEAIVRELGQKVGLQVHPHMLRHTYATHTLTDMQRDRTKNGIEPLVFLQKQLGHSSIRTTMAYLHLVNEIADNAVLAYDEELNAYGWEH